MLVVRLTRGTDRVFVRDTLRRIDDHVVSVLSREIDAARGFRWARPCDAQMAARFILGALDKVAMDAMDREDLARPTNDAMAHEIGGFVFFALANPEFVARHATAVQPEVEASAPIDATPEHVSG